MANDILSYARDFYEQNLDETDYRVCDVSEIRSFPKVDLLVGCYPCQGFSQAGVRQPDRAINFLYREFDRALRTIKPKFFIVENVSGMVRSSNLHLFRNQITRFRLAGYRVTSRIVEASSFGVCQERRRLFFVGIRSDLDAVFTFPEPTHEVSGAGGLKKTPTLRQTIGDLPEWPEGHFDQQPFHWYYLSRNRRREWDEISRTIVAAGRHTPLHPSSPPLERLGPDCWQFKGKGRARRLSIYEAARIQGFPKGIEFPDTYGLWMKYRVIGNAVPPPLFEAIARALPDL